MPPAGPVSRISASGKDEAGRPVDRRRGAFGKLPLQGERAAGPVCRDEGLKIGSRHPGVIREKTQEVRYAVTDLQGLEGGEETLLRAGNFMYNGRIGEGQKVAGYDDCQKQSDRTENPALRSGPLEYLWEKLHYLAVNVLLN
jgi:hypothetical protein